jgi:hypothetical protein
MRPPLTLPCHPSCLPPVTLPASPQTSSIWYSYYSFCTERNGRMAVNKQYTVLTVVAIQSNLLVSNGDDEVQLLITDLGTVY